MIFSLSGLVDWWLRADNPSVQPSKHPLPNPSDNQPIVDTPKYQTKISAKSQALVVVRVDVRRVTNRSYA